mgnify:CR=1 FL=1
MIIMKYAKYIACLTVALLLTVELFAQTAVSGRITDKNGESVIGATILVKGTTTGTSSDAEGRYKIVIPAAAEKTLQVSYLGYKPQEIAVGTRTRIDIELESDEAQIEEVVVVGYGTLRKSDVTGAVTSVKIDKNEAAQVASFDKLLQGHAAGVQVTTGNAAPGGAVSVKIRGTSSFNGTGEPLYVVDGIILNPSSQDVKNPLGSTGQEAQNALASISPQDIASMEILKDASATAIYGSMGANGVVLITTKQGSRKRGPEISFSTFVGISKVTKSYDVLNARQYRDLMEENGAVSGLPADLTDRTDWFDETYSTGVNQNYQFSVSNGDENSSYYLGGGYTNEKGIINTTSSDRYNVKASFDKKIFKWVSANASTTFSHYTTKGTIISGQGANRAGVVVSAITTPTYAPIWDPENPQQFYNNFYGANLTSPRENMARTDYNQDVTDRLLLSGGLTFYLAKDLTFKSTVSMDRRWVHSSSFLDPIRTSYGRTQHGTASDTRSDDMRMIYDNILTWNKSFDRHSLEVMAGTSATTSVWEQLSGSRSYFSSTNNNAIPNLNGGNNGGVRGQSYGKSEWSIMSYLARVSYNYDSKYLVTANFRADGSSKLAPGHRWGYFPSFSAAWRISGEKFLRDVSWINDLKLRAGWGQTGNQAGLAEYGWMQQYSTNYYDWTLTENAQAVPTVGGRSNIKNEDLTWETSSQTNVGLDFALLNNRLSLSLDYYYKYTKDMLMSVPLPSPYPNITRNDGEMSNQGFEITLSSVNIARKDFNWSTDLNVSLNRNKVEKLNLKQVYYYATTSDATNDNVVRMTPGHPLSMFWGYVSKGVDPETGDLVYEDHNGDGEITPLDKTWIGNANPKFTFGMTNNFSWKGLNLNILITGSYGNDIFNASRIETEGMASANNQTTTVLRRWRIPGQQTDVFRSDNPAWNVKNSSYWVEDGSYLKVKNITLSYDITSPKLKRINITRIQPYISLQNFITWTGYSGYDPEVSQSESATQMGIDWGTYPNVRTVVVGLNLTF